MSCHTTNLVVYAKRLVVFFFVTAGFIGVGGNGRESVGGEEKRREKKGKGEWKEEIMPL